MVQKKSKRKKLARRSVPKKRESVEQKFFESMLKFYQDCPSVASVFPSSLARYSR
jgi:hypothetical protein